MADRDYYCTSIDTPFTQASECIIHGLDEEAAASLIHNVTKLLRAAAAAGACPLDDYVRALTDLALTPPAERASYVFHPLPSAPGKMAELARRAMMDIATDIEFGGLGADNIREVLLARTCQEIQEWGLLTRFEVNARLGVNGESPQVQQSIAAIRKKTSQTYTDLAAQCLGDPQHADFQTPKTKKPKTAVEKPLATFLTPGRKKEIV